MQRVGRSNLSRRQLLRGITAVGVAGGLGASWPARCSGRFYPGAAVAGIDVSGLSRPAAVAKLQDSLRAFEAQAVTFHWDDRQWHASAADLGVTVDYDATLRAAWRHGRDGGLVTRYATLLQPDGRRVDVAPVVTIDEAVLDGFLSVIDADTGRAPRDARLHVDGFRFTVAPDQAGTRLDLAAARHDTREAIRLLQPTTVVLNAVAIAPDITAAQLEATRAEGERLLSDVVTVINADVSWTISVADLAGALVPPSTGPEPRMRLDPAKLSHALLPIASAVDHPPHNATVAWDQGLYVMAPGTNGVAVDLERLATEVVAAAATTEREVALPVMTIPPPIDGTNLEALGINTPLARGQSSFAGSSSARATNVAVAAYFVSQTLVPPGETFSFNDAIGAITVDKGYVEGKIISGDWFTSDLGGGVCQVSTTVFRAALLAGLPFTEWNPHSFRLGFYELDGWPPGMDAAIYQPDTPDEWALDLRFTNPTDAWMLVQANIEGETLVIDLVGAPTRYEVELSEPSFGDLIPAPEPLERHDPEAPVGTREQVQVAQTGVEVTVTRLVRQDGEVVLDDTFVSPYAPQAEIWSIGASDA